MNYFAYDPHDTEEIRDEKVTIFLVSACCSIAGIAWTTMYYIVFGFGLVSFWPALFFIIVVGCLIISHVTRNHKIVVYGQIICIIYITTFIQWSIGGVFDSGFVLVWAFCGPIIALMFFSYQQSLVWLTLYIINILITVLFNDFFTAHGEHVDEGTRIFFFVMNLTVSSMVVFVFAAYFIKSAIRERENANKLLLNILPAGIARSLKSGDKVIAEKFDSVTILFADIVDFTRYSSNLPPEELVLKLNEVFIRFDDITEHSGLEKIKTIGDAYMVAGGVPEPRADHAVAVVGLGFEMLAAVRTMQVDNNMPFTIRIGIHTGPVVAGVIGKNKFSYDLWGDTVNVASRMEATGQPGSIQITGDVYELVKHEFEFDKRQQLEIKGKGLMQTYISTPQDSAPQQA